jgi:Mrp family chromosome partitioning ATPase
MWSKWLLDARDGCTIMAFTSRSPREGVSTVVAGLARAIGAIDPGRVLVLDITSGLQQEKSEMVSDLLEVEASPVWVQDIETDDSDLSSFVTRNIFRGTDILSLKYIDRNRPGPQLIRSLLDRLRSSYHVILMDIGPLTDGDRLPWLSCSDYRILVIDATTATREILEHQRRELEHMGITINGSILNKRAYPIPSFLYWLAH